MTTSSTSLPKTDDCSGTCRSCPSVGSCAERLVCKCLRVTEHTVITAIRAHGLQTVSELKVVTGAGDGCMCCHKQLRTYLTVYAPAAEPVAAAG